MLNLAEFLGLISGKIGSIPSVAYFHENQLTYPVRNEDERDYQFAMTNLTTALAATSVWFNSSFHRDSFAMALDKFLKRMPDQQPLDAVARIRGKSDIQPQGIGGFPKREASVKGPMRVLWAARWEHDKNPEDFFAALRLLKGKGVEFRLSVIGEQFRDSPAVFQEAEREFANLIDHWGYQESREEYEAVLLDADAVVSTANHEFFGISVVEAISAGAYPLLPNRLAYPEILSKGKKTDEYFYDGTPENLAKRLAEIAEQLKKGDLWRGDPDLCRNLVSRFEWNNLVPVLDEAIERVGGDSIP